MRFYLVILCIGEFTRVQFDYILALCVHSQRGARNHYNLEEIEIILMYSYAPPSHTNCERRKTEAACWKEIPFP